MKSLLCLSLIGYNDYNRIIRGERTKILLEAEKPVQTPHHDGIFLHLFFKKIHEIVKVQDKQRGIQTMFAFLFEQFKQSKNCEIIEEPKSGSTNEILPNSKLRTSIDSEKFVLYYSTYRLFIVYFLESGPVFILMMNRIG